VRRKVLVLLAAAIVGFSAVAACGQAVEDQVRQRVEEKVEQRKQRAKKELEEGKQRARKELEKGKQRLEQEGEKAKKEMSKKYRRRETRRKMRQVRSAKSCLPPDNLAPVVA
jgi:flagellar biosynthesis/type III secretory pathway M-ring protein FliF/YscJ